MMELIANEPKGLSLQELTDLLQYAKSSTYKIVTNLVDEGYVWRNSDNMKYFLSRKLLQIGLKALSSFDIIKLSTEPMTNLRNLVGESVMIGALTNNEVVLLNQVRGNLDFVFTLQDGMRFNLYSTAPGKALFAFMPANDRRVVLEQIDLKAANQFTITSKERLEEELNKIVERGFAQDLNETVEGVHCIAAPIFDESGSAVACVWTSGPAGRLPIERVGQVAQWVQDAALVISKHIGYMPLNNKLL